MNVEEQLLRIFGSLYYQIKQNNHEKVSFDFFCQETFLPLTVCIIILIEIIELSCWTKGIIGVVM